MDYAISGGLGFIGKNLVIALNKSNKEFSILDKLAGCDLCKQDIILPDCSIFIHLAAITDVRKSILNPEDTILQNIKSTLKCLNYARNNCSEFIFTSSMGAPYALSPYSSSKLACESICTAYRASYGLKIKILRLSNVYGPHSIHKSSVISKFIRNCLDKEPLTIYGNGLQTRDFVYVDDVVKAITNCNGHEVTNVSTGRSISIMYLAKLIRNISTELTTFTPNIEHVQAIKGEIDEVEVYSNITNTIQLKTGLTSTFKWFMEHYDKRLE